MRQLLHKLFLFGVQPHLPDLENRRTYVCNQIAFVAFIISILFFILNLGNEVVHYFFFVFWVCDLLVFYLNKSGILRAARLLFILSVGSIFYGLGVMIEAKWPELKSGFLIIQLGLCCFPLLFFSFQRDFWLITSLLVFFSVQMILFYPLDRAIDLVFSDVSYSEASLQNDLQYVSGILIIASSFVFYQRITQRAEERVVDLLEETQAQNVELQAAEEEIRQTAHALQESLNQLDLKSKLLERSHQDVLESITYARRIQMTILPPDHYIRTLFADYFVYYQPRDIVSGDFYWIKESAGLIYLAVVDCTGHGVPGAFMSVMAYSLLNQILHEHPHSSSEFLVSELDHRVQSSLRQQEGSGSQDGMDLALCVIDPHLSKLEFTGANRPLYLIRDGALTEYPGNKYPVGGNQFEQKHFSCHRFDLLNHDQVVLFSDGITDQFGSEFGKRRKFSPKRLRNFLLEHAPVPMSEMGTTFRQCFDEWMTGEQAIDDHTLFAFRWIV